jgi:hypothetical protein
MCTQILQINECVRKITLTIRVRLQMAVLLMIYSVFHVNEGTSSSDSDVDCYVIIIKLLDSLFSILSLVRATLDWVLDWIY